MFQTWRVAAIALAASMILLGCGRSPTAPSSANTGNTMPPTLDLTMTTNDPTDTITVSSQPANYPSTVRVCLSVTSNSGWWKGIGLNQTNPTIQGSAADGVQCANMAPGLINLTFWKAKIFGAHTEVGTNVIDLTQYANHVVTFSWWSD